MPEIPEKHVGEAGSHKQRVSSTAGLPDQVGNVARRTMEEVAEDIHEEQGKTMMSLGPLERVYVFWLAGMSCDGCTVSVSGATEPALEDLLTGSIPGLPLVILHHYVLQLEAGDHYIRTLELAEQGKLGGPYVVVYEGSIPDETLTVDGEPFAGEGSLPLWAQSEQRRRVATAEWVRRLAPGAAATTSRTRCRRSCSSCKAWGRSPNSTSWAAGGGSSPSPSTATACARATTKKGRSPKSTATRNVWSRSAAGGRWCSATSPSAAR